MSLIDNRAFSFYAYNKAVLCFETSSYSKQDILSQYIITDTKILSCSGVWLHYKKRI